MAQSTGKKIENFQASVGSVGADIGLIGAYIFAGILILAGISLTIYGLIPREPFDCSFNISSAQDGVNTLCTNNDDTSPTCTGARQQLKQTQADCSKKRPHYVFLLFLLLIPLGIGVVMLSKLNRHFVKTSKSYAAAIGTVDEIEMVKNALSR